MTDAVEKVARAIAYAMGYEWDSLYADKQEYLADRGSRHDINTPRKPDFMDGATAAIAAHTEWLAEQGLVICPREPTEAMITAGCERVGSTQLPNTVWAAMITAAPGKDSER